MNILSGLLISLLVLAQFNSPAWSQSNKQKLRPAPLRPAEFLVLNLFRLKPTTKNQSPSTSRMRCCIGTEFLLCKTCVGGKGQVLEMQRAKKFPGK